MVPGVDGVGRREDGQVVYFAADDELAGPMATRTVIDTRRSVMLPDGVDVVKIAAAMNPAMSAWVALRRRVPIQAGQRVLVLGATGSAGRWPSRSPSGSAPAGSSGRARPGPPGHPAGDRRGRHRRAGR